MRIGLVLRVVAFGVIALFPLGRDASYARADSSTFWCQNGELMVQHTSDSGQVTVMSLGRGEYQYGNMTISCNGDRVRTVMPVEENNY